jgi:transcriptional regulator with XRE-family HTH domain
MDLGKNLKHFRKAKGVTQVQLAKDLGIDKSTIACYETNRNEPNIDMLKKLALYFDVTLDDLLGD